MRRKNMDFKVVIEQHRKNIMNIVEQFRKDEFGATGHQFAFNGLRGVLEQEISDLHSILARGSGDSKPQTDLTAKQGEGA